MGRARPGFLEERYIVAHTHTHTHTHTQTLQIPHSKKHNQHRGNTAVGSSADMAMLEGWEALLRLCWVESSLVADFCVRFCLLG
jgi:hypothetical protein